MIRSSQTGECIAAGRAINRSLFVNEPGYDLYEQIYRNNFPNATITQTQNSWRDLSQPYRETYERMERGDIEPQYLIPGRYTKGIRGGAKDDSPRQRPHNDEYLMPPPASRPVQEEPLTVYNLFLELFFKTFPDATRETAVQMWRSLDNYTRNQYFLMFNNEIPHHFITQGRMTKAAR